MVGRWGAVSVAGPDPWRGSLLHVAVGRLHTSNAPTEFRKAGGCCSSLRAFAFLLAAADAPAKVSERDRRKIVADRFALPVTPALKDAVAEFERLIAVESETRRPSPIDILSACLLIEEIEAELAVKHSACAPSLVETGQSGADAR